MKVLLGFWIITLSFGVALFLGCYLPFRLWNASALPGFCNVQGFVQQGFCRKDGCFKVFFVTNVVGFNCTSVSFGGIYNTKQQAESWAHGYYRSYSCFYQKTNSCDFSDSLRNTQAVFIVGCVFSGLGIIMLIIWLIAVRKKRQYEEI